MTAGEEAVNTDFIERVLKLSEYFQMPDLAQDVPIATDTAYYYY